MQIPRGFKGAAPEVEQLGRGVARQQQAADQNRQTLGAAIGGLGKVARDVQEHRWTRMARTADAETAVATTREEQRLNEIRREREVTQEDIRQSRESIASAATGRIPPGYEEAQGQALDKWEADTSAAWAEANYKIELDDQRETMGVAFNEIMSRGDHASARLVYEGAKESGLFTPTQLRQMGNSLATNEELDAIMTTLDEEGVEAAMARLDQVANRANIPAETKAAIQSRGSAIIGREVAQQKAAAAELAKQKKLEYDRRISDVAIGVEQGMVSSS